MVIYTETDWAVDARETGHCQICFFKPGIFMIEEDAGFCPDCRRWYDGYVIHRGGKIRIRDGRGRLFNLEDAPEALGDDEEK